MPDSQVYAKAYPEMFVAQREFLLRERERFDVRLVVHEGDVTDDNSVEQWERARVGLWPLVGEVPIVFALGNHDYGLEGDASDRTTRFHDFFPFESLSDGLLSTFEDGRTDNALYQVSTPTGPLSVLSLEFGPRETVVEWASVLLALHTAPTLLLTHAYLYSDSTRYDRSRTDQEWSPDRYGISRTEAIVDSETLYAQLVRPHSHVRMVLSGHVLNEGVGRLTDTRPDGSTVHQLLANYQTDREGGASYLRFMEFDVNGRVHVRTYSPFLREEKVDLANRFKLTW